MYTRVPVSPALCKAGGRETLQALQDSGLVCTAAHGQTGKTNTRDCPLTATRVRDVLVLVHTLTYKCRQTPQMHAPYTDPHEDFQEQKSKMPHNILDVIDTIIPVSSTRRTAQCTKTQCKP